MALQLTRSGNYLKLIDDVTGIPHIERPAKDMFYRDGKQSEKVWFYFGNPNVVVGNINGYGWSELGFADYPSMIEWLDTHTASDLHFTDGGADVILQDSTSPLLIVPLSNIQYTTALSVPFNKESYEMTVDDITGFDTLDFITVYNATENRVLFTHPLSILGNTVTLKIPSDFDFPAGSPVTLGSIDMAVDGSVTPQVFGVRNPTADDIPLKFDISRIIIKMLTNTAVDLSQFGDIAGGLTRGVLARRVDGTWQNLFHWDNNGELKNLCYSLEPEVAQGNQQDGLTAIFNFGGQGNLGSVVRIGQGEDFQIVIQDKLDTLVRFRIYAEGSIVSSHK